MTNTKANAKSRKISRMAFPLRILAVCLLSSSSASAWPVLLSSLEYWWYKYRKNPNVIDVTAAANAMLTNQTKLDAGLKQPFGLNKGDKGLINRNQMIRTRGGQPVGQLNTFKPRF